MWPRDETNSRIFLIGIQYIESKGSQYYACFVSQFVIHKYAQQISYNIFQTDSINGNSFFPVDLNTHTHAAIPPLVLFHLIHCVCVFLSLNVFLSFFYMLIVKSKKNNLKRRCYLLIEKSKYF